MRVWILWAVLLLAQNFSFTFVSRARNSGSLLLHMAAAMMSNGVWFLTSVFTFSKMLDLITGKYGVWAAIGTGLFYTIFTVAGSLIAHIWALHSERGRRAVGANKKLHQVTTEEWEQIKRFLDPKYLHK